MQHDVFANPAPRARTAFPFVAVLQADIANVRRRVVIAPMAPRSALPDVVGRVAPVVSHAGGEYVLILEHMTVDLEQFVARTARLDRRSPR